MFLFLLNCRAASYEVSSRPQEKRRGCDSIVGLKCKVLSRTSRTQGGAHFTFGWGSSSEFGCNIPHHPSDPTALGPLVPCPGGPLVP